MTVSIFIKKYASKGMNSVGLDRVIVGNYYYNKLLILAYHRIIVKGDSREYIQEGMYVDVNNFEKQLIFLKKRYNIIHIKEVPGLIRRKNSSMDIDKRPYCVLTFDDGWADFYYNAFPVIKKHEVVVTVFLPTNYIGTDRMFWTDHIAYLLINRSNKENIYQSDNSTINWIEKLTGGIHTIIESVIKHMKYMAPGEINEIIQRLHDRRGIPQNVEKFNFLSWEQVHEMAKSGFINYGSHSDNHYILNSISEDSVYQELILSKDILIKYGLLGSSFIPFCYPNGGHNDRIVKMVQETGYNLAVTTRNGWNDISNDTNLYTLKRISIHEDITSTIPMFSSKILNLI